MNIGVGKKAIVLAPHPDDIAYSMAGTIMSSPDTLFHIVYFHQAIPARLAGCRQFWASTPNAILDFESAMRMSVRDAIGRLDALIATFQPDTIFRPSAIHDTHQEHMEVGQIGLALARQRPITDIEYRAASLTRHWVPNIFFHFGKDMLEQKLKRLQIFSCSHYFTERALGVFHHDYESHRRGIALPAEQFRLERTHAIRP